MGVKKVRYTDHTITVPNENGSIRIIYKGNESTWVVQREENNWVAEVLSTPLEVFELVR